MFKCKKTRQFCSKIARAFGKTCRYSVPCSGFRVSSVPVESIEKASPSFPLSMEYVI